MSERYDLVGSDFDRARAERLRAVLRREVGDVSPFEHRFADETDLATIDLEPTAATSAPSGNRRAGQGVLAAAAVAFVVVVIALLIARDDDATPADQPSPTVTVPSMPPPGALPMIGGDLVPGTYFVDEVAGAPTPRIFATLGAWWANPNEGDEWNLSKRYATARDFREMTVDEIHEREIGTMTFDRAVAVFADACHPSDRYHPGPVTTLDGLVAALSQQEGWAEVTAPSAISIDGYAGKAFQRTAPDDMSDCDTRRLNGRVVRGQFPDFRSWESPDGGTGGGFYYEPGHIETLWVLDLDGTLVVVSTKVWPQPSAGASADFAADVLDSIRITDQPSPTVTVPVTAPPRALPGENDGAPLESGTYFVDEVSGTPTLRIIFTIGDGWEGGGGIVGKRDIGFMTFDRPGAVFSDACHPSDGYHPGPVTTLDGLVAALSEQQGWVEVTAPSDISIDGYVGKSFQRTARADMVYSCDTRTGIGERIPDDVPGYPDFRSWENPGFAGSYYEPGEIETLWVLDIDGTVVVISTGLWPEASAAAHADFAADVLDSIRIDRT